MNYISAKLLEKEVARLRDKPSTTITIILHKDYCHIRKRQYEPKNGKGQSIQLKFTFREKSYHINFSFLSQMSIWVGGAFLCVYLHCLFLNLFFYYCYEYFDTTGIFS